MPTSNVKADNQYYGKFFEQCIEAAVNGINEIPIPWKNYLFTDKEKNEMMADAKLVANILKEKYHISHVTWVGEKTIAESGDLVTDDGLKIEIKRVSNGKSGTYHNTSMSYFTRFGFDIKSYMTNFKLYDAIDSTLNVVSNRKAMSPVNRELSSDIRHNRLYDTSNEDYKNYILPVDIEMRKTFTEDLKNYFNNNPKKLVQFYMDMMNKVTCSNNSYDKQPPDILIAFNYIKKTITEINIKDLLTTTNSVTVFRTTSLGMVINTIRFAFGWQNGDGLNNPTIRTYV